MTLMFILWTAAVGLTAEIEITDLSETEISLKQTQDMQAVKIYRDGLAALIEHADHRKDLFPKYKLKQPQLLKQNARKEAHHADEIL